TAGTKPMTNSSRLTKAFDPSSPVDDILISVATTSLGYEMRSERTKFVEPTTCHSARKAMTEAVPTRTRRLANSACCGLALRADSKSCDGRRQTPGCCGRRGRAGEEVRPESFR